MHDTFEGVQHEARPLIRGPLKVYFVLLAFLITVLTESLAGHVVATVLFLGLAVHAVGVRPVRWVGVPLAFLLPGIGIILLVTPGVPLLEWWQLSVTTTGVQTAVRTLSRSVAALSILAFLVLTTPVTTVIEILRRAKVPGIVLELFLYIYRAIQITLTAATEMRTAGAARLGFRTRRTSYRSVKLIASSLLVRSFDRMERFGDALRARNYEGSVPVGPETESSGHGYAVAILGLLVVGGWL